MVEKFCSKGGEVLPEDLKSSNGREVRPPPSFLSPLLLFLFLSLSSSRDSSLDEAARGGQERVAFKRLKITFWISWIRVRSRAASQIRADDARVPTYDFALSPACFFAFVSFLDRSNDSRRDAEEHWGWRTFFQTFSLLSSRQSNFSKDTRTYIAWRK